MTVAAPSSPRRLVRPTLRLAAAAAVVAALVAPALGSAPAGANGLSWEVRWADPVTTAGPNRFAGPVALGGTASPPVAGNPNSVAYAVAVPAGYPAACAVAGGNAELKAKQFTARPAFACNGTYTVSVVAKTGGLLPTSSSALKAPVQLADPGSAPGGLSGAVDGAHRRVTISWAIDTDPDVVGYRVRRDGVAVADVGSDTRLHTDTVGGPGTYRYDVQTLRWGAGGPGSAPVASPPSAAQVATVNPAAPPTGTGTGTGSGGAGPGPGGVATGNGSSSTAGTGSLPGATTAAPKLPTKKPPSGATSSRSKYRSGGTISPSSSSSGGATEADTYEERLPYQPEDTGRTVELSSPDSSRTVAKTVSVPGTSKPGLVVPLAVVLVLVAASVQIRSFLHRTAPAPIPVDGPS